MDAVILAGGMGTRLRQVITDMPKPMAPVNGKPFLVFLLKWLAGYPIDRIIISTGYKSEQIIKYFGDSYSGIPVEYVIESNPLGTGGAIKFALTKTTAEDILILNGDTYFPIDVNRFYSLHRENNSRFSVALKQMTNFERYGSVECNGCDIIKFNEKRLCQQGLINGGIYIIKRDYFESKNLPDVFSLEKDVLEKEAGTSVLKGFAFNDEFIDIGIPEDYFRAESVLAMAK